MYCRFPCSRAYLGDVYPALNVVAQVKTSSHGKIGQPCKRGSLWQSNPSNLAASISYRCAVDWMLHRYCRGSGDVRSIHQWRHDIYRVPRPMRREGGDVLRHSGEATLKTTRHRAVKPEYYQPLWFALPVLARARSMWPLRWTATTSQQRLSPCI